MREVKGVQFRYKSAQQTLEFLETFLQKVNYAIYDCPKDKGSLTDRGPPTSLP